MLHNVALQETKRTKDDWPVGTILSLESLVSEHRAFNGCAKADGPEPGMNGMALLVREDIRAHQVGKKSGYWIFARVCGGPVPRLLVWWATYIDHTISKRLRG